MKWNGKRTIHLFNLSFYCIDKRKKNTITVTFDIVLATDLLNETIRVISVSRSQEDNHLEFITSVGDVP